MWRFIFGRVAMALLTIFATTVAVTLLIHLVPGDPVQIMYAQSQGTTPEQIEQIRRSLGLDQPIYIQYFSYVSKLLHGDLGYTIRGPAAGARRYPAAPAQHADAGRTRAMALSPCLSACRLASPLTSVERCIDTGLMMGAIAGVSIPHFWLGLLFLLFFAVELGWFPVSGTGLGQSGASRRSPSACRTRR